MADRFAVPQRGVAAALAAAVLFGIGTPLAKHLLAGVDPWLLAGLLYVGAGLALSIYRHVSRAAPVRLQHGDARWLAAAVIAGGIVGPVLLLFGLRSMPAASAALLLNAEVVLTAIIAWFVFRENVDRRVGSGMLAIAAGAVVLSWPGEARFDDVWPACAVLGACLAWAIDNNLTRRVALADAAWVAAIKGWGAGSVNIALAVGIGARWPANADVAAALGLGAISYGVSLALFVVGLRDLGTARTGAYFSVAPFFGALGAIVMFGEPVSLPLATGGGLMALGVFLHLSERHGHAHTHAVLDHEHEHVHDEHHRHDHADPVAPGIRHSHRHQHAPLRHTHPHYPDAHHRHEH